VRADPTQVHQVVLNLCTNAMHAIGDRTGVVTLSIQPVQVGREEADEINGLSPGAYLRLSVSDTGHGMDEATLGRIFDPFFTTKKPGEGTGLGLAVVRGIVSNHQGALRVRSTPGIGTVFDIFLPSAEGQGLPAAEAVPPQALVGAGEEILIVDDESQVANFIAASLRRAQYRALTLTDPRDAQELVQREAARFSAVVTDLTMPHMNGMELLARLRQSSPGLPAVIVTGYSRDLSRKEAEAMPRTVTLGKPFTGPELVQALSSLLRASASGS
jgi:CheY-like chemotaxis protein